MKAIFINGSPRKNGNTAQLLKKAMEGARDAGAEVEFFDLYDHELLRLQGQGRTQRDLFLQGRPATCIGESDGSRCAGMRFAGLYGLSVGQS